VATCKALIPAGSRPGSLEFESSRCRDDVRSALDGTWLFARVHFPLDEPRPDCVVSRGAKEEIILSDREEARRRDCDDIKLVALEERIQACPTVEEERLSARGLDREVPGC